MEESRIYIFLAKPRALAPLRLLNGFKDSDEVAYRAAQYEHVPYGMVIGKPSPDIEYNSDGIEECAG